MTVTGCAAGSNVVFTIDGNPPAELGQAAADATGSATINASIPSSVTPGQHTVTATCGALSLTSTVQVLSASQTTTTTRGSLPVTGSDSATLWRLGSGLFLAGTFLVLLSVGIVRRRTAHAS